MGATSFYEVSLEKSRVRARRVGSSNWGREAHLYRQDVEDAFSRIEDKLARLQEKFASTSTPSADERCGFAMWLLASYLRTPEAFLASAEVGEDLSNPCDLFDHGYAMLTQCVTNPHCIEMVARRDWQIIKVDKPYFLKPDSGVVLTDRLDSDDCQIIYPLTPNSCLLATGRGGGFSRVSGQSKIVNELNDEILRWSRRSIICTTEFWERENEEISNAVRAHLNTGQWSPPKSGRFFVLEGINTEGEIRGALLGPRGPVVFTVSESAVQPIDKVPRPQIPGLYDVEDDNSIGIGVRFSDDDSEINYTAAAALALDIKRADLAARFARKALEKDDNDLYAKLVLLTVEPDADVGALSPRTSDEAAQLGFWWALEKKQPLSGLAVTSAWLKQDSKNERLIKANFLCAMLGYGSKLVAALCGHHEPPPLIDNSTPLPDGVIEFVNRLYSHSETDIVSNVQEQIGQMDVKRSGIAADMLRLCGINKKFRLYRADEDGSNLS